MDSHMHSVGRSSSFSSQCYRGCACEDCICLVAEDAASQGSRSSRGSGPNTPRSSTVPDVPYLQSLQSRLRQSLGLYWSPERRDASRCEIDGCVDSCPAATPAALGRRRFPKEIICSAPSLDGSYVLKYTLNQQIYGSRRDR